MSSITTTLTATMSPNSEVMMQQQPYKSSGNASISSQQGKEKIGVPLQSQYKGTIMVPNSPTETSTETSVMTKGSYYSVPTQSSGKHSKKQHGSRRLSAHKGAPLPTADAIKRRERRPPGRSSSHHKATEKKTSKRSVRRNWSDVGKAEQAREATRKQADASNSPFPSTNLDKPALLERLQRLSCHLAGSMVETLLQQMEREEQAAANMAKQKKSTKVPLSEQEKLLLIQAQLAQLEASKDENMQTLAEFEFALDDSHIGMEVETSESEDEDSSDSSSSSSYLSESEIDMAPLSGSRNPTTSLAGLKDLPRHRRTGSNGNASMVSEASPTPSSAEQLVTKIGQTRLNRTLKKSTTTPSVASDNTSVVSQLTDANHNNVPPRMPRRSSRRSMISAPAYIQEQQTASDEVDASIRSTTTPQQQATAPSYLEPDDILHCDSHKSAICLVDISGFTNLSRELDVEGLSKTINQYFQIIVDLIHEHGGDIIKFAGDALIVEWKVRSSSKKDPTASYKVVMEAATCASRIVDKCSDFPVYYDKSEKKGRMARRGSINGSSNNSQAQLVSTLNVHVGMAFGHVMSCCVGDSSRREYLIFGEAIQQVANAMENAKQGEVVASPQAYAILNEAAWIVNPAVFEDDGTSPQIIASKADSYFKPRNEHGTVKSNGSVASAGSANSRSRNYNLMQQELSHRIGEWQTSALERLLQRMSSYVHPAVLKMVEGNGLDRSVRQSGDPVDLDRSCHNSGNHHADDAELREVFTTFIQPDVDVKQIMGEDVQLETVELLHKLMLIVNSEVMRFKGQLRQFIVDDKGLVIIANFGLRGSTFPNMVEERGLPCISNIKTLVKTELDLNCRIGATFGKAYCGIVGAVNRHEYAVLGSPVNLAARLMATKDNNGILVDEAVMMKASHHPFESLDPVKAKGYDNPVKIYRPRESIRKSWKSLSSNFVGRNLEMGAVALSAKNILKSKSHAEMVFFTGPYGVGKSLVLAHAVNRVKRACGQALKTCYESTFVFCEEDSFKPFSILRPLFLDMMKGNQSNSVNINLPSSTPKSTRGSRKSAQSSGSSLGSSHTANFSLGDTDSIVSGSIASGESDNYFEEEESVVTAQVDEKMLNLQLVKLCLECGIPLNYVEVFGGLIFTDKLSDIGSWADRGQKQSEWDLIAQYIVKAFLHVTARYDLVVLALDEAGGMDEMSWKIVETLYQQSTNLLVLCAARSQFDINIPEEFWNHLNAPDNKYFSLRELPNMNNTETLQLVYKKLGRRRGRGDKEVQSIAQTVHILSNGNPLMASEILNKLYLKFTPAEEESMENLGYVGELLMNRLDSLDAGVLNHLNLGALLGVSFYLEDIVAITARYNEVRDMAMAAHSIQVKAALQVAVDNGILFLHNTSCGLYCFAEEGNGRPFELDEVAEERMETLNLPEEEREKNMELVYSVLEERVQNGMLLKHTFKRTTYTFSHEFWQKSIGFRTLDGWKNEMMTIKAELDAEKRALRQSLLG